MELGKCSRGQGVPLLFQDCQREPNLTIECASMITALPAITTESAVPYAAPARLAKVVRMILGVCLLQGSFLSLVAAETSGDKGISYKNDRIGSVPWSVHVVKIPRNDPTLEMRSTLAKGTVLGLSRLSDQALDIPSSAGTPLAGVNGDFYEREGSRYAGDPRGLQIVEEIWSVNRPGIPAIAPSGSTRTGIHTSMTWCRSSRRRCRTAGVSSSA